MLQAPQPLRAKKGVDHCCWPFLVRQHDNFAVAASISLRWLPSSHKIVRVWYGCAKVVCKSLQQAQRERPVVLVGRYLLIGDAYDPKSRQAVVEKLRLLRGELLAQVDAVQPAAQFASAGRQRRLELGVGEAGEEGLAQPINIGIAAGRAARAAFGAAHFCLCVVVHVL